MDIDILLNILIGSFVFVLAIFGYLQYIISKKYQKYIGVKIIILTIFNIILPALSMYVLSQILPFPNFEEDVIGTFILAMFVGGLVYYIFPIVSVIFILITHLLSTFFSKRTSNKSYLDDNKEIDFEK